MLMMIGVEIQLSAEDRSRLERLAADRNQPQKHVWRAQIVLLSGDGGKRRVGGTLHRVVAL